MNGKFAIHACLLGGMLITGSHNQAKADEWNKKTYFNISRSFEVPGAVLPPGRYVFKLLDSSSNRHIVQIMNDRENHVYATNLAIPKQRTEPADKTILTFYETPGGGPEPVRAWFYPGDTIGQEFAYPRHRALEISRTVRENVPILADSRTSDKAQSSRAETIAPIQAEAPANYTAAENSADRSVAAVETPTPAPVETAEASAAMPDDQAAAPPAPNTPAPSSTPEPAMPHTAGNTAGIALLGLGCLGVAATLRKAAPAAGNKS